MKMGLLMALAVVMAATLSVGYAADVDPKKINEASREALSSTKTPPSAKELYASVKKPTTRIELLKNIKFALDHELLLRDDFFTDENLMQIFCSGDHALNGGLTDRHPRALRCAI